MTIRPQDLELLDRNMQWRVAPGTFEVMIGSAADNIVLRDSLQVKGIDSLPDPGLSTQPDLAR